MLDATLSAVVVHWNQGVSCAATIDWLDADPHVGSIVVVDNASEPSELAMVRAASEGSSTACRLIENMTNEGFGPATNRGWQHWLDHETTDWCLTLPHDVTVAADTIESLVAATSGNPRLGLVSADVGDGLTPIVDRNFGPIFGDPAGESGLEPCDYPHGTMFMARRTCLEQVGLYDPRFFTYCEEADLGLRAKAAGWEVGLVRGARVFNPRVSTPRPVAGYLMERNTLLLVNKHFGLGPTIVRTVLSIGQLLRGLVQPSVRTEYWTTRGRLLALRDVALRRFGPPPSGLT